MMKLNDAQTIKALLLDFLINEGLVKNCLFGCEIYFGSKKRQTDFLAVNGSTTAFEIKANNDDFRRIREQLNDYKKVFDYQYIVTTNWHVKRANQILHANEGLIVVNENGKFQIVKKAKRIIDLDKAEILETVPLSFLKKNFKINSKYKNCTIVRNSLLDKDISELRDVLIFFLKERLAPRNLIFFNEKGNLTHFEDVKILSTRIADEIL